jgi:hypothetical protein
MFDYSVLVGPALFTYTVHAVGNGDSVARIRDHGGRVAGHVIVRRGDIPQETVVAFLTEKGK